MSVRESMGIKPAKHRLKLLSLLYECPGSSNNHRVKSSTLRPRQSSGGRTAERREGWAGGREYEKGDRRRLCKEMNRNRRKALIGQ